jgi:hypothetical protein
MKDISTQLAVDANTLSGKIDGTVKATKEINDPMVQFFQKLMDIAGITPNGDDENEVNGYQLIDAMKEFVYYSNGWERTKYYGNISTPIDMTIANNYIIPHGLTGGEIITINSIDVILWTNDTEYEVWDFKSLQAVGNEAHQPIEIDETNIKLYWDTTSIGGKFSSTIFKIKLKYASAEEL